MSFHFKIFKTKVIFMTLWMAFTVALQSNAQWNAVHPTALYYDVWFTDENNGYAVGDYGAIIKTTNGGANWTHLYTGSGISVNCIQFIDANTGFCAGYNNKIYKTTDAGQNWKPIPSPATTNPTWYSIDVIDANNIVLVGTSGKIIRTSDGGVTWAEVTSNTAGHLYRVRFHSATSGYATGTASNGDGVVLKTTDKGVTWTAATSPGKFLESIHFIDDNTGYATGGVGLIAKTTDGGSTWTVSNNSVSPRTRIANDVRDCHAFTATKVIAAGSSGNIVTTSDGGATDWTLISGSNKIYNIYTMQFLDANKGYAVGTSGAILKTTDGGANWTNISIPGGSKKSNGLDNNLNGVYFTSETTGWAVADNGGIVKTTDIGETWPTQTSGTVQHLYGVYFTDATTGYIVGAGGTILKTTDGGTAWGTSTSGVSTDLKAVHFPVPSTGYTVGIGGVVLKTTDSGTSWAPTTTTPGVTDLHGLYFWNASKGIVVGASGLISKTIDGGATWTSQNSGSLALKDVQFAKGGTTGYIAGASGTILKSIDEGATWTAMSAPSYIQFSALHLFNSVAGFFMGNGYMYSTGNGSSFTTTNLANTVTIADVHFPTPRIGFAVTEAGLIFRIINAAPVINEFTPESSLVGETVTIKGFNFKDITSVKFNGTSATFTVDNTEKITATVPVGATSGKFTIVAAGGTGTSPLLYTVMAPDVTPPAAPVISGYASTSAGNPIASGNKTNDATLFFKGTAEANSKIAFTIDGVILTLTTNADGNGNWIFDYTGVSIADGSHIITATAKDAAGNISSSSIDFAIIIDATPPSATITTTAGSTTNTSPIPMKITFSEDVTDFTIEDITLSAHTKSNFSGSGKIYSFTIVPTTNGVITVNIAANAAQDGVGNGNIAAIQFTIIYLNCSQLATPLVTEMEQDTILTLISSSSVGNQWYRNGNIISGATSQTLQLHEGGSYTVKITVDGCSAESAPIVLTGIESQLIDDGIKVYPNPVANKLKIAYSSGRKGTVGIFDVLGKPRLSGEWSETNAEFDLSGLEPGIYILEIESGVKKFQKRIIKTKN